MGDLAYNLVRATGGIVGANLSPRAQKLVVTPVLTNLLSRARNRVGANPELVPTNLSPRAGKIVGANPELVRTNLLSRARNLVGANPELDRTNLSPIGLGVAVAE